MDHSATILRAAADPEFIVTNKRETTDRIKKLMGTAA
jgi:hypothetical protein